MSMDWDKLRVFHEVARVESFTHAGDTLNLSQSAVSRQIGALEDSLSTPLFHRHARGLKLTEQGERLFRTVRDVFDKLTLVETQIADSHERPQGPLTVTTTVAFGSIWLTSRIHEFLDAFPDIDVTVRLSDVSLDLSMREADVAIRMMPATQPDLVQRHLMSMHYNVYAAPQYLKRHGMPKSPADLDEHRLIVYGDEAAAPVDNINWLLEEGTDTPRKPILRLNSVYGIFRAVQSGLGIAALPDYMSRESLDLVQVLPELQGPEFHAYFIYPEELRDSKRINVFRDFLLRRIAQDPA